MDQNHRAGQEMMNLNYLNQDEVKRMAGEPAHSITNHPRDATGELVDCRSPEFKNSEQQEEVAGQRRTLRFLSPEAGDPDRQQRQVCVGHNHPDPHRVLLLHDHILVSSINRVSRSRRSSQKDS